MFSATACAGVQELQSYFQGSLLREKSKPRHMSGALEVHPLGLQVKEGTQQCGLRREVISRLLDRTESESTGEGRALTMGSGTWSAPG